MNISASECSSGCESGWTTYFDDHLSNSVGQYPKVVSHKNGRRRGVSVYEEDEDMSMVSDASSGPRHYHEEGYFYDESGYYSYQNTEKKKNIKKVKEQRDAGNKQQDSCFDDTASSPFLSYYSNVSTFYFFL